MPLSNLKSRYRKPNLEGVSSFGFIVALSKWGFISLFPLVLLHGFFLNRELSNLHSFAVNASCYFLDSALKLKSPKYQSSAESRYFGACPKDRILING
jgi:hypothetical protein